MIQLTLLLWSLAWYPDCTLFRSWCAGRRVQACPDLRRTGDRCTSTTHAGGPPGVLDCRVLDTPAKVCDCMCVPDAGPNS